MSTDAIYRISTTIRDRLRRGINAGLPPGAGTPVELVPPTAGAAGAAGNFLSLWVYQATEDEFARNQPPAPVAARDAVRPAPLRLNLHLLLTPVFGTHEQELQVLGRAMGWFHENAVLQVRSPDTDSADTVRVSVGLSDLEGLARVWEALQQPYRLSVGYLARTARIDPTDAVPVSRVVDTAAGFADPAAVRGAAP